MSKIDSSVADILVTQLEFWTGQLVVIARQEERCRCELADIGIIVKTGKPSMSLRDRPVVTRMKEKLLSLYQKRNSIYDDMAAQSAQLLDEQTMEVVLSGGPEPGSYLSWQPGEPVIAWWRKKMDVSSPRMLLPGIDPESTKAFLH